MNVWRFLGFLMCCFVMLPNHVFGEGTGTNTTSEVISAGQTEQSSEVGLQQDLFEKKDHYFHPFLSLNTYYTDNLFNDPDDEKDDIVLNIIPGIWVAVPGIQQPLLPLNTLNTAPGGLRVSRFTSPSARRFQGYGLYRANIRKHDQYSDEDKTDHHAEGRLAYQFQNEASIEAINVFQRSQDPYATGTSRKVDVYDSNLFNVMGTWPVSQKFAFRADYSYYYLDYTKDRNSFRNRDDNAASGYVFYKVAPKTTVFLQYEYVDVDYDEDILADSEEHHYFGGVRWVYSEKTRARFKLGYGKKDFDKSEIDSYDTIIGELQLDYQYSEKTAFKIVATRQINESTIEDEQYMLTHSVLVGYTQRLMPRLEGKLNLVYLRDSYRGTSDAPDSGERRDNYYRAGVELGYTFRTWLTLGVGYRFTTRDSNDGDYDYDNNTFFLGITGAI